MHTVTLVEELDVKCTFTAKHIPLLHSLKLVKCLMPNVCNRAISKHTQHTLLPTWPVLTYLCVLTCNLRMAKCVSFSTLFSTSNNPFHSHSPLESLSCQQSPRGLGWLSPHPRASQDPRPKKSVAGKADLWEVGPSPVLVENLLHLHAGCLVMGLLAWLIDSLGFPWVGNCHCPFHCLVAMG